ncbi:MAG: ThuA domain-containing protein [Chloroflexi bacterium]|nr:ThuA domain-containing protein [Chloroflexota bacterium]
MTVKILLLLGGVHHDFAGFAAAFQEIVGDGSHAITTTYDGDALLRLHEEDVDVVALYTCLGGAKKDNVVAEDLTAAQTAALVDWVRAGGSLLALHAATVLREENQAMRTLIGGRFLSHPPQFDFAVSPLARKHPLTDGVGSFTVHDEFYMQEFNPEVAIHMTAEDRGIVYPMVWTKDEGHGQVVYIAPGHTATTWTTESYRQLLRQSVRWLAGPVD